MKTKLNLIVFIMMVISFLGIKHNYGKTFMEPNIDKELKKVVTKNYIDKKIYNSLSNKNIEEALIYKNLATYLHIEVDPILIKILNQKTSPLNSTIRDTKDFSYGFFTGNTSNTASLGGSITSDMTVIGDIRDIYKQTTNILEHKQYNKFTLGLSVIGVTLTATTIFSDGGTAPLKIETSILKSAEKSGKITKSFSKIISKQLDKTINLKILKKIDYTDFKTLKASLNSAINQEELIKLEKLLSKLSNIKKQTSTIDTLKLLKYIDNEKDLTKIVKLSKKYKQNTIGVFKVLGKSALKSGKYVVKYTKKLITFIFLFITSLLWFLF